MSERIKKLEKEFNCPIINRQARGVEFTYQGQRLVRYAEDLLNSYTSVRQELLAMGSEPRGTLNLGCSNVFAKYHIPHILSTFKEAYPHIDIIMYTGLSYKLYHDFLEGRLHAAIIRGAHTWTESKEHIWSEPFCFFNKTPCAVEDLPRLPYIHYQTDPNLQQTIDDWWYSHYSQPPMR
ncbi:LysR family transcriptional regulator, partial [Veillonella sp.]|uniref:LysR family transcriptional regulator n=1 Tax=Veillonella sp. TaxID=1926307 RepID=UPI00257B652A